MRGFFYEDENEDKKSKPMQFWHGLAATWYSENHLEIRQDLVCLADKALELLSAEGLLLQK